MRRWLGVGIAGLYVLSVPWYRTSGAEPRIVLGLPDWVAVALGCYLAIAILNAVAWLHTEAPDTEMPDGELGVPDVSPSQLPVQTPGDG